MSEAWADEAPEIEVEISLSVDAPRAATTRHPRPRLSACARMVGYPR